MDNRPQIQKFENGPPPSCPDDASRHAPWPLERRVDPKLLAAYQLGFLSYGIWY